jgi:hypothetical protein
VIHGESTWRADQDGLKLHLTAPLRSLAFVAFFCLQEHIEKPACFTL